MATWKVKLEGDENLIYRMSQHYREKEALVIRDGNDWFLESTEFALMSEHTEVRRKGLEMVQKMMQEGNIPPQQQNVHPTVVYRIHYDNSKTVYRD
jgi:hypothetical protein